jgi:replicative DNA helicase
MVIRAGTRPASLSDTGTAHVPPYNLEAEESVLGACLLSREAMANVLERIKPDDFYKPAHTEMFNAMLELYSRGEPIDAVTLAEELRRRGTLESLGGKPYIFTLVQTVPTAGSAVHYARIVEENALLRRLIDAAHNISEIAYSVPEDVEGTIDYSEDLIYKVSQRRDSQDFQPLRDLLTENMETVEKLYEQGENVTGLPTGFADLDNITAGLQSSNLVIIAARPAMGKSALALTIAQNVAVDQRIPVVIFSLEMSKHELVQRLMCSEARVDSSRLRRGKLQDSDWPKISHALGRLAEAPIFIDDSASVTIMEMRAKCRRLKAKHGLGLVILDYLQLMQPSSRIRADNRVQEIGDISRSLKILARELDLPVIAVSQLSRNVEHRTDKRPMLADLRDSGTIEQDADIVMFIYRDEVYDPNSTQKGLAEIIIAKHRSGPIGKVDLAFLNHYTKFESLYRNN